MISNLFTLEKKKQYDYPIRPENFGLGWVGYLVQSIDLLVLLIQTFVLLFDKYRRECTNVFPFFKKIILSIHSFRTDHHRKIRLLSKPENTYLLF